MSVNQLCLNPPVRVRRTEVFTVRTGGTDSQ
jgi:hypothetical protein